MHGLKLFKAFMKKLFLLLISFLWLTAYAQEDDWISVDSDLPGLGSDAYYRILGSLDESNKQWITFEMLMNSDSGSILNMMTIDCSSHPILFRPDKQTAFTEHFAQGQIISDKSRVFNEGFQLDNAEFMPTWQYVHSLMCSQ